MSSSVQEYTLWVALGELLYLSDFSSSIKWNCWDFPFYDKRTLEIICVHQRCNCKRHVAKEEILDSVSELNERALTFLLLCSEAVRSYCF